MRLRVPPGRTGRLWLRRRLTTAARGLDLLDRKLRILRREHERLTRLCEGTGRAWAAALAEAETWTLRAATLGGERSLRLAAATAPAELDVTWTDVMGATIPAGITCAFPPEPEALPLTAAIVPARAACRTALSAAATHAAALEAAWIVAAEVATTTTRIRALRERWVPALRSALAELELALDETERYAAVQAHRG